MNTKNKLSMLTFVVIAAVAILLGCGGSSELSTDGGEKLLDSWVWHHGNEIILTFNEDGTGYWDGVEGEIGWGINRRKELVIHDLDNINYQSRWEFEVVELAIARLLIIQRRGEGMFLYVSTDDLERTTQLLERMEAFSIDPRSVAEYDEYWRSRNEEPESSD